jgi:hypothetical protein
MPISLANQNKLTCDLLTLHIYFCGKLKPANRKRY